MLFVRDFKAFFSTHTFHVGNVETAVCIGRCHDAFTTFRNCIMISNTFSIPSSLAFIYSVFSLIDRSLGVVVYHSSSSGAVQVILGDEAPKI